MDHASTSVTVRRMAKKTRAARTKVTAEIGETRPNTRLVGTTIAMLKAHDEKRAESAREVGAHVLAKYFGGREALVRSRNPHKAKSYALLAERAAEETEWDVSALRKAVEMACVYRSLSPRLRKELPSGWLFRLAAVDDVKKRTELAERIAAGEIRGVAARRAIALAGREEAGGGRAVQHPIARALGAVERALGLAQLEGALDEDSLDEIDDRAALSERLTSASRALAELAARLRG